MNYILSFIFWIAMAGLYKLLGKNVLQLFAYKKSSSEKEIIAGFFSFFFIGFVIGVPCQIFHVSWNLFFRLMLIVNLVIVVLLLVKERVAIKEKIAYGRHHKAEIVKTHLKEYWFIYAIAGVFSLFSMTNTLPYYEQNYDDAYYIGKVVNQVGAKQLSVESYFTGAVINTDVVFDYRLANTFEIVYGFLAQLFRINIPFFCRVTMVFHNYFLIFLLYKTVYAEIFQKKMSQYAVFPFALLLVPAGFAAYSEDALLTIRMYDAWQFQTAIFYGSSIVRVMSIPTILLFGKDLFQKIEWKKVVFVGILFCSFMSFSTVFLENGVFLLFVFIIAKALVHVFDKEEQNPNKKIAAVFAAIGAIVLLVQCEQLAYDWASKLRDYQELKQTYLDFFNEYMLKDIVVEIAPYVLTALLCVTKGREKRGYAISLIALFWIVRSYAFESLYIFTSMKYQFVHMRFITSIQLMCLFTLGCIVVYGFSKTKLPQAAVGLLSFTLIAFNVFHMYEQRAHVRLFDYKGSGTSPSGYAKKPLLENDMMMAEVFKEVGAYFNQLEYGNYTLLVPETITYDNTRLYMGGLIMSSNRIELVYGTSYIKEYSEEDKAIIEDFYENPAGNSEAMKTFVEKENIQYLFVVSRAKMEELQRSGFACVMQSKEVANDYYLMKTNY